MEWWQSFKDWFLGLGEHYHVNPYIFGGIYIGAIPFFFASLYSVVSNIRKKKSIVIPALLTGFFFVSAYFYLIIAGEHIPVWVYVFIGLMIVYGVFSTLNKIKARLKNSA